jgi:hypothetical protein
MRERPPPQIEDGQAIDAEFVIPIYGLCFRLGVSHSWVREDERVQVCEVCGAEWWNDDPKDEAA